METEPKYDLDEFVFKDRSDLFARTSYAVTYWTSKFSKTSPLGGPVHYRQFSRRLDEPNLVELGKAVGIKTADQLSILSFHKKRDIQYRIVSIIVSIFITLIPSALLGLYAFATIGYILSLLNLVTQVSAFIGVLLLFTMLGTILLYGIRIAAFLVDKYFADTLCLVSCIFLLIELSRENVLIQPDLQRSLLFRLRILARNILLLAYYYESPNDTNNAWIRDFFKKMEMRVREYERWIIAPNDNTLRYLRKEINKLTRLFIDRNYEEVSYELPVISEALPQDRHHQLATLISRVIGITIPGLVLATLYFYPNQFDNIGLDKNIVGLISISWLLLTMDVSLGLGVTDRVSGLAKAIKDLK